MTITPPGHNIPIVNRAGLMQQQFWLFVLAMAELDILQGEGSPEGVVEALPTRLYMDKLGVAGSILYIKRDADVGGDKTLGWIGV